MKYLYVFLVLFPLFGSKTFSFNNIEGIKNNDTLRVAIKHSPPFVIFDNGKITGENVDLWGYIADSLNIQYRYVQYKSVAEIITAIKYNDVDITIIPITVTSKRLTEMYFSQPTKISSIGVVSSKKKDSSFISVFFNADFFMTIIQLIGLLIVVALLFWAIEYKKNDGITSGIMGFFDSIWFSAVTMTTVGYGDKTPVTVLGKILAGIWMFSCLLIVSYFTGKISSAMTLQQIEGIEKVSDLKGKKVATVNNTLTHSFLIKNKVRFTLYDNLDQCMDALLTNEISHIVYDKPILNYYLENSNMTSYEVEKVDLSKDYNAFASNRPDIIQAINPLIIDNLNN